MNRRHMLKQMGLALAASGLAVPAWILDPLKGRSMVTVPGVPSQWLPLVLGYAEWMKVYAAAFSYATYPYPFPLKKWNPNDWANAPRYFRAVSR